MAPSETFDAVVIGSGIGGLTAARMLAEFGGRRVLVVEQHYVLGGLMHEFTRVGRYSFNTGVHYLTGEPGPALNLLTGGRVQFCKLPSDYDVLHFPGLEFRVPAGEDAFIARLTALFPAEASGIRAFFRATRCAAAGTLARHIAAGMPRWVSSAALPVIALSSPDTFRTIEAVVERLFTDPRLKAIVSARWGLYGPPPAVSAFGSHALVGLRGFMDGASYPVGGPRELSSAIIGALARFGVDLRASQRVTKVRVKNDRTTGVTVEDSGTGARHDIDAPVVISAAGARNTARLLDTPIAVPLDAELAKLPTEISTLVLFVGFSASPSKFGLKGENHWFMPDLGERGAPERPLGEGTLFVSFSSLNNPAARHHTAEVMHFVDPARFSAWFGTEEGSRPQDYERLKAEITERLLERLDNQWPGFRAFVAFAELATPLTFVTYQNSVRGAFYGLASSPERLRSSAATCRTGIRGLFLAGQDAAGPGIEAALWGGIVAANAVLATGQARKMWRAVSTRQAPETGRVWSGYLRIAQIEALTPAVQRIRLAPLGGGDLPFAIRGGQYLTLDLPIVGEAVRRSYSIISAPSDRGFVDIAVKRKPGGLGSGFLLDEIAVGEALRVSAPHGDFTADFDRDMGEGRLLLLAGGIGITPMIGLLKEAADASYAGPITLLASFRSREEVIFAGEIETLARRLVRLEIAIHLTGEPVKGAFRLGRIDREALLPASLDASRVHVCGPAPMMRELIDDLLDLGIVRETIHNEAFVADSGSRTLIERSAAVRAMAADTGVNAFQVAPTGRPAFAAALGQDLLAAALHAGVPISHSCREGICGKCRVRILSGRVDAPAGASLSNSEIADGWVLACRTLALDDLEITLAGDDPPPPGRADQPARPRLPPRFCRCRAQPSKETEMSIKTAIAAAAVSVAGLAMAGHAQEMPSIVLVHGAWANGSSWSAVIPLLQAHGYDVVAVHNPASSFEADVAVTRRVIDDQPGDVILVGHSYGGAVITEAGGSDKVRALVYVAAFAPAVGQSVNSIVSQAPEPPPWQPEIMADAQGWLTWSPAGMAQYFAPDLSADEIALLAATQAPLFAGAFEGQVTEAAWSDKPSWYLVADQDQIIPPQLQDYFAQTMGATVAHVAASHLAMLSQPQAVADAIIAAADGVQ